MFNFSNTDVSYLKSRFSLLRELQNEIVKARAEKGIDPQVDANLRNAQEFQRHEFNAIQDELHKRGVLDIEGFPDGTASISETIS